MLTLVRVGNLLAFGDWQDLSQSTRFLDSFFIRGFRFDLKLLSSILILVFWLPVVIFSWFVAEKYFSLYLRVALKIFMVFVVFLIFVDIGYIFYFQKPIDVLIFGLFEDDTSAVISTIFDDYNLLLLFAGFIVTAVIMLWLFSKLLASPRFKFNKAAESKVRPVAGTKRQLIAWFISFLFLFVLARGSLDSFPLQRKHASVSDNTFLNQMVMNSAFNLYYAYRDKGVNNQAIFKQDILKANKLSSLQELIASAGYSDKQPLQRTTVANEALEKARLHVIFVLMEGWSSQIALAQSEDNNVLGEFERHAQVDHFYPRFFANQYATNPSVEALLLSSPITPLSQSVANETHFSLSNVLPFKRQDYQTLFLSGGYSSWRNHNNFWLKQGFDRYLGRSQIENYFNVDASDNPWGVYDEFLFKYLKQALLDAEKENRLSFNFVLTTNNHPPVRLPESYRAPPLDVTAYGIDKADQKKHSMLTGYHYQSDQLGRFLSWLKNSEFKDKVIVVATGDHPLRHFADNKAAVKKFLHYSVPAYFYVPEAFDQLTKTTEDIPGSHNDLFPTLYELALSNATYYNFGQPIMEKNKADAYGWAGQGEFIFSDGVADSANKLFYPWAAGRNGSGLNGAGSSGLLSSDATEMPADRSEIIRREYYRKILKQYLLVQDYKRQVN
jgi:phosphoglycerol transferase MdoB-like AlkP superfamily enzyme